MASHDVPIGSTQVSLAQLNERSREIFRQIVESYLATGEPVGSRNISRLITDAAVAGLGAQRDVGPRAARPGLCAAHLGRAAADRARAALLRRCADGDRRPLARTTAATWRRRSPPHGKSLDAVLSEASGMLSGLTHAAGVVMTAKANVRLKHIEFVRLEPERALVVLVAEDGQVENRIIDVPIGLPTSALTEAGEFPQRACPRPHPGRGARRAREGAEAEPGRARSADAEDRRRRLRELVGRRQRRPQADRARPRQSARRSHGARGPRTRAAAVRRSRNQARRDRPARPRRGRRRRAHLHRLGEQAVLAVGLLHHRRALSRRRRPHHRRDRA